MSLSPSLSFPPLSLPPFFLSLLHSGETLTGFSASPGFNRTVSKFSWVMDELDRGWLSVHWQERVRSPGKGLQRRVYILLQAFLYELQQVLTEKTGEVQKICKLETKELRDLRSRESM